MKSFRIKRFVSFALAVMMLVSMCTAGIVTTSAAYVDAAETGATITGGTTFYLDPGPWDVDGARFAAYFCNGSSAAAWYSAYENSDGKFWVKVNSGESHANIIWVRMNGANTTNDWNNRWNQTGDLTWDGSKNLFTITQWDGQTSGWSAYTAPTDPQPSDPPVPDGEEITISFVLETNSDWVSSDDANMFIKAGNTVTQMDETVDQTGGHLMWTAEVSQQSSYTFYRAPYFYDESNATSTQWNKWESTGNRNSNTVYKATGSGTGSWQAGSTVNPANPTDVTDFWDDLWIAPADHNDVDHAIKVWYDKDGGKDFNLFVPSYVDLSNVYVYSDHPGVEIAGVDITSGTIASLTAGEGKTFYLNKSGGSVENKGKLNIYQTESTAALHLNTKEELFTGTTAGLANSNAYPSGSGITTDNYNSAYKDAIETKGTIYLYGEDGALVNEDNVLKKIKGRGNSSFEASMKIYGKYAYNFNLDEKVALIDGATASKKWCLLANNVDHSMMRNTFIYQLADDLGMTMGPETRLVDAFNNGKYLGAFVITEKVEYGKNTLMATDSLGNKINNLDDGNVEANSVYPLGENGEPDTDQDPLYEFDPEDLDAGIETTMTVGGKTYKYKYYATYDRPEVTDDDGNVLVEAADNLEFKSPSKLKTKYNYLLEHELSSRYPAEASWFITDKGQPVVVKYPEFANKEQMEWIISEYAAMEQAVYANDYDTFSTLIDVDSFAKMYLMHELSINLDSCATSYYIHNEYIDGKSILFAGPTWDFDWAFGAYAKDLKYIYNGSSVVTSKNMSEPEQMFIKDKAIKTDATASNGVTWANNYNLQAKMAHNSKFWTECQRIWTNDMVDLLYGYVCNEYDTTTKKYKDSGIIVDEWLPKFKKSVDMNNARWNAYNKNDDWGTKVTSDYAMGSGITSKSNFKVGDTSSSGSASKCYENTVYYLNDWLVRRLNYMSGTGDLYNEDLLENYEVTDVTFTAVPDADNDKLVTITPSATVTFNDTAFTDTSKYFYTIYVNDVAVTEAIPFSTPSTDITLTQSSNEVYVEVTVADSKATGESDVQTITCYIPDYKVENVNFVGEQSEDGSMLTITPSADVTLDGNALADWEYTVIVNQAKIDTYKFSEFPSITITLNEGVYNVVAIKVTPIEAPDVYGVSATQSFGYNVVEPTVEVTVLFKSSASYRYVPSVIAGKEAAVAMTKGDRIAKNATGTQTYNWFTATVAVNAQGNTDLTFTNSYSMRAKVTITNPVAGGTYYFGCDNLNDGTTAVNLSGADEYVKNFVKSAVHMLTNDPTAEGVATTSIGGTIYKMGDADSDNTVSVMDATAIQLALADKGDLSQTGQSLADYDLDGGTSIMDATNIQIQLVQ